MSYGCPCTRVHMDSLIATLHHMCMHVHTQPLTMMLILTLAMTRTHTGPPAQDIQAFLRPDGPAAAEAQHQGN